MPRTNVHAAPCRDLGEIWEPNTTRGPHLPVAGTSERKRTSPRMTQTEVVMTVLIALGALAFTALVIAALTLGGVLGICLFVAGFTSGLITPRRG